MINVVVVSHGNLGEMLIQAAEMIVGRQEGMRAVSLLPEESPEALATSWKPPCKTFKDRIC